MELSNNVHKINSPVQMQEILKLRAGDIIYINGVIFTARDMAYKRILREGKLPFSSHNYVIYNCGPLAIKKGDKWDIRSAGPTTSSRMEELVPKILQLTGVRGIIGKGKFVKDETIRAFRERRAFYGIFPGGAGALAAKSIREILAVYWIDLGIPEAVWVLKVVDFGPVIVAIDTQGNTIWD